MKKRPALIVLATLVLFILIMHLGTDGMALLPRDARAVFSMSKKRAEVTLRGSVKNINTGESVSLTLEQVYLYAGEDDKSTYKIRHALIYPDDIPEIRIGQVVEIRGKLADRRPANPGSFDTLSYDRANKIDAVVYANSIRKLSDTYSAAGDMLYRIKKNAADRTAEIFGGEHGIISALILGEKSGIDQEVKDAYSLVGISHILVISGFHLQLIYGGIFSLIKLLGAGDKASASLGLILCGLFILFTGYSIPAERAFIMMAFSACAKLVNRTYDRPCAIIYALIFSLFKNPYILFYSGFWLSYGASAMFVFLKGRGKIATAVLFYVGMLPVFTYFFYYVSVFGVAANLLIVPLVPVLMPLAVAGLIGGKTVAVPAILIVRIMNYVVLKVSSIKFAKFNMGRPGFIQIILYYIAFAIMLVLIEKLKYEKKRLLAFLITVPMIFTLGLHKKSGLEAIFLDVGQGDCAFFESESLTVLSDCGSSSIEEVGRRRLEPYLAYKGVRKIDYVIISHADADHVSGIIELLSDADKNLGIRIGKVIIPKSDGDEFDQICDMAKKCGAEIQSVTARDEITKGDLRIHFLNPGEKSVGSANADSVVMHVSYKDFDMLLTGDVEEEGEINTTNYLKRYKETGGLTFEILKVAHHGSNSSTSSEFLNVAKPKVAVISAGRNNVYGHPHEEVMERLDIIGAKKYTTPECGAVLIKSDGDKFEVSPFL